MMMVVVHTEGRGACSAVKRENLLVETGIICHSRGLILCNAKCLQFHQYKKQERSCTVQIVFYSTILSFFKLVELLFLFV